MTTIGYYGEHDDQTFQQFALCVSQPGVLAAALMPDAHVGYTMPIGGVVHTKDAVYPSWVGYDIGCGVCAVKVQSSFFDESYIIENSSEIYGDIKDAVPTKEHSNGRPGMPDTKRLSLSGQLILQQRGGYKQLGTLGSGNHFIEIAYEVDTHDIWIVIHSGSRGVGHGIGGHWMKVAECLCGDPGGMNCLLLGTADYRAYMQDQKFCIEYALANRVAMLEALEGELNIQLDWGTLINKVHNVATEPAGGGVLHRKGATDASKDELGVIPGNMRDGSVIVVGKGCFDALNSCSHGAGRAYSRGKAFRELSLETFESTMEGIKCNASKGTLDECPDAYKNFEDVMHYQAELCEIIRVLKPLINFKG